MGVAAVESLQAGLLQGLPAATPAGVVQHASLPTQRQLLCTLGTLAQTVHDGRLGSPAIVIVGDVLRGVSSLAQPQAGERAA